VQIIQFVRLFGLVLITYALVMPINHWRVILFEYLLHNDLLSHLLFRTAECAQVYSRLTNEVEQIIFVIVLLGYCNLKCNDLLRACVILFIVSLIGNFALFLAIESNARNNAAISD
jgi:hypothetical protein